MDPGIEKCNPGISFYNPGIENEHPGIGIVYPGMASEIAFLLISNFANPNLIYIVRLYSAPVQCACIVHLYSALYSAPV